MRRALFALTLLLVAADSSAGIVYYKDEQGNIHAVDSPDLIPEQYREKAQTIRRLDADSSHAVVQLERRGNSLWIPVTLGTGTSAVLVLDTGAEHTMISSRLAKELNLPRVREVKIHTAGGTVDSYTVILPAVSVKQFTVRDLEVTVNDIPELLPAEGLLGVDFMHKFKMSLDTETGTLTLDRK